MTPEQALQAIAQLPKAELHLHLEGAIRPAAVVELAQRYGDSFSLAEATKRYEYADFAGFIEAFKWVTSYLREPPDYALLVERLIEELAAQRVVYAEVIVALGVMLWREQDPERNFRAMQRAAEQGRAAGVELVWLPDVTRQFGAESAMRVAEWTVRLKEFGAVAFGMGGDELSLPAREFRAAYDHAAANGLHCTVHAGEVGGPNEIREGIELLHAERIGHGIAAMHDVGLRELLRARNIPLEVCPTSNSCTGALAKQLAAASAASVIAQHPLADFFREGVPVTLSSDDPAMFHTTLADEYAVAQRLGLDAVELADLAQASFDYAFLTEERRAEYLAAFNGARDTLGI